MKILFLKLHFWNGKELSIFSFIYAFSTYLHIFPDAGNHRISKT